MKNKIVIINYSAALVQEDSIMGNNRGAYYYSTQKNSFISYLIDRFQESSIVLVGFSTNLKFRVRYSGKVKLIQLPCVNNFMFSSLMFNLFSFIYLIIINPSLVYVYSDGILHPYFTTSLYSKLSGRPFFLDVRNPPYSLYISNTTHLYKRLFVKITDYVCMQCSDVIVHISEAAKELIKSKGSFYNKSISVPSCASDLLSGDMDFFKNKENNNLAFVTWGVIDKSRKLDIVIRAFKKASELNPNFNAKLFLIGDGEDLKALKELANSLKVSNVIFKGYMKQKDLFIFLQKMDVALIPIPSDKIYYQVSSPLKLAEAISLELPVVASDIIPNNIVKKYDLGILCGHDVESYTQAFLYFWNISDGEFERLKINCRNSKYMFSPKYIFNELGNLIEKAL